MSVEKRCSRRYPFSGDVYIRYRKQRAFPASALDCSEYGMYLKTKNLTLLTGAMVELEFFYKERNWQIEGVVTHCQRNGLGVMFWSPQSELYGMIVADKDSDNLDQILQKPYLAGPENSGEAITN
jgi:hypothetical protein